MANGSRTKDYQLAAADDMHKRFGVKRYRLPRRCAWCGCKAVLFNAKTRACFECCMKLDRQRKGGGS